jgi:hypothetical protein
MHSLVSSLQDIVKVFNLNITSLIEDIYKRAGVQMVSVGEEFLRFLRFGICSQEIQVFLSKELNDTKILQRVDEKITLAFQQIQDVLAESAINSVEEMLADIHTLAGQSKRYPCFIKSAPPTKSSL